MIPLDWITTKVQISQLKDYEYNPRSITKHDFELLVKSIKEDGYHGRILVDTDYTIIGGHSRRKALLAAGYSENQEIEVLVANRKLSEREFRRLNVRDNLPFGNFDMDMLANHFEVSQLIEDGFDPSLLFNTELPTFDREEEKSEKDNKTLCKQCPFVEAK